MKYIAVDTETTGLDPIKDQLLEVCMIVDEIGTYRLISDLPKLHFNIKHEEFHGHPVALEMNKNLIEKIKKNENCIKPNQLKNYFSNFVLDNFSDQEKPTLAGKNVGSFDYQFLNNLDLFTLRPVRHRFIDLGNLYYDITAHQQIPDLKECLAIAGLVKTDEHTAYGDCVDIVRLMRYKYQLTRGNL